MFNGVIPNSAKQVEEISRLTNEKNQREAIHRAKLEAGAEASIEQKELLENQLEMLKEQNKLLFDNYDKLKTMYDAQSRTCEELREDLKSSRKYNLRMMIISIIAMLGAIAGPIATIIVGNHNLHETPYSHR